MNVKYVRGNIYLFYFTAFIYQYARLYVFRNNCPVCPVLGWHVKVKPRSGAVGGKTNLATVCEALYVDRFYVYCDVTSFLVLFTAHIAGPQFDTINIYLAQHGLYQPVQLGLVIVKT